MSGGSFQYAYAAIGWQAEELLERVEAASGPGWEGGLRLTSAAAVGTVAIGVRDMARAVEWFFSNDTGDETLREQAASWPEGVPAPGPAPGRAEECNRALIGFADQLEAKLADPEAIYVGGSLDDVPPDLRLRLEGMVGFCRAAAIALRQVSCHLDGDTTAEMMAEAVAGWPPGLVPEDPGTAPAPR